MLLVNAIHTFLTNKITHNQITIAKLQLNKFVFDLEKLYGIEQVSYNVHLLTHLPDSVLKHGPLWSISAFIFEDMNRQLLLVFHGTQSVSGQMVRNFLSSKKVPACAKSCIPAADEHIQRLFANLTKDMLPGINNAERFGDCSFGLGVPHSVFLSLSERMALQNEVNTVINPTTSFMSYQRFTSDKMIYHTHPHSLHVKRSDCVF